MPGEASRQTMTHPTVDSRNGNLTRRPVLLVTGANGFLGRAVVARALLRGWTVRAAVRPGDKAHALPPPVVAHDIDLTADAAAWRDVMKDVDVVIHAAARAHVIKETAADPAREFAELNHHATEKIA